MTSVVLCCLDVWWQRLKSQINKQQICFPKLSFYGDMQVFCLLMEKLEVVMHTYYPGMFSEVCKACSTVFVDVPARRSWRPCSWGVRREPGAAGRRSGWWGNTGSRQSGSPQNKWPPGPRAQTQVGSRSRFQNSSPMKPRLLQEGSRTELKVASSLFTCCLPPDKSVLWKITSNICCDWPHAADRKALS